ncbi:MAG TPA: MerR family transcriptional regulator [Aquabacterium sp.]|nr:MerR family transcriptional regulator [Aquabacterium sp.]
MKIGELAKLTGLTASSIRFYEASGLISSLRQSNGYRHYDAHAATVLHVVRFGQQLGFSLDEIKGILPPSSEGNWQTGALVAGLHRKVAEVDAFVQRLGQTRLQLLALIDKLENQPGGLTCEDMAAIRELSSG